MNMAKREILEWLDSAGAKEGDLLTGNKNTWCCDIPPKYLLNNLNFEQVLISDFPLRLWRPSFDAVHFSDFMILTWRSSHDSLNGKLSDVPQLLFDGTLKVISEFPSQPSRPAVSLSRIMTDEQVAWIKEMKVMLEDHMHHADAHANYQQFLSSAEKLFPEFA